MIRIKDRFMTDIGDTLPVVTVKDSTGADVNLSELSGPLVLYYYPKADTPGCTTEGQEFTAQSDAFKKAGCTIYGISKDKPAKLTKFAAKYGLSVTLLSDEESDVTEQMGVWVEKNMYGKKYMGIERATFLIGGDGKVAQVWRKVKVKGHVEAVLAAAQSLA
jgi:thioredoxin-dependent peroxiredoxin